jgi:hypothetical protein
MSYDKSVKKKSFGGISIYSREVGGISTGDGTGSEVRDGFGTETGS